MGQFQTTATPSPALRVVEQSRSSDNVSDEQLVEQIRSGDIEAYTPIMRRYNQRVFRIARSIVKNDAEAMDIVQEAHIKAYTKLGEFNGSGKFSAWLGTITRNEALAHLRKYKRETVMADDELEALNNATGEANFSLKAVMSCPDSTLENKQLKALINQHIDELPQNFRTIFVLRAVEQLSVRETAEIEGIKEETVKTRYFRAKRLLREQIQAYLETAGLQVYEFGGYHCDIIVKHVMQTIRAGMTPPAL